MNWLMKFPFKMACFFGFHVPLIDNIGFDSLDESKCWFCGQYLVNGKVTSDPGVKERVDKLLTSFDGDIEPL